MAMGKSRKMANIRTAMAIADAASLYCALVLALVFLCFLVDDSPAEEPIHGKFSDRPCDEIYVVEEGETLHTISDKCGDPFIVEQNPHIQDPDDVYPGLVIKITPKQMNKKGNRGEKMVIKGGRELWCRKHQIWFG